MTDQLPNNPAPWRVAALYRFVALDALQDLQAAIRAAAQALDIRGTLLLAPEGFNGTLAGDATALDAMLAALDGLLGLRGAEIKFSTAAAQPFRRLKIRVKKEIITFGATAPDAHPAARAGVPVDPADWNVLIARDDVLLLDTRNDYETKVGGFAGAADPNLKTFTDFKDYAATLDPRQKIAMYCTGGIRCEKASAYLLGRGFTEIYQLQGGILRYLAEVPAAESRWQGTCFVFDERGSLGHGLAEQPITRD